MNRNLVTLLLTVWLAWPSVVTGHALVSGPAPRSSECFRSIVRPGGWELPSITEIEETGPYKGQGIPERVTFVRWRTTEPVWLPWYYVSDDRLMLDSHRFEFEHLTRLEIEGRPFALFGFAKGRGVGMAANVRWQDSDGDGVFEELEWFPDLATVPSWVAGMSTKLEGR